MLVREGTQVNKIVLVPGSDRRLSPAWGASVPPRREGGVDALGIPSAVLSFRELDVWVNQRCQREQRRNRNQTYQEGLWRR